MILRKIELATSPTPRLRREQKEEKETRKKEENFLPFLSSPPPPPSGPENETCSKSNDTYGFEFHNGNCAGIKNSLELLTDLAQ